MKEIKATEVLLDWSLYPRKEVNREHVFNLAEAIRSGATLPPIVICKDSRRVVDGFHRTEANKTVHGPEAMLTVVEKSYSSDQEFLIDAIKYNAAHGRNLSGDDRARCVELSIKLGVDESIMSGALCVSPRVIGALKVRAAGELNAALPRLATGAGRSRDVALPEQEERFSTTIRVVRDCVRLLKRIDTVDDPSLEKELRMLKHEVCALVPEECENINSASPGNAWLG